MFSIFDVNLCVHTGMPRTIQDLTQDIIFNEGELISVESVTEQGGGVINSNGNQISFDADGVFFSEHDPERIAMERIFVLPPFDPDDFDLREYTWSAFLDFVRHSDRVLDHGDDNYLLMPVAGTDILYKSITMFDLALTNIDWREKNPDPNNPQYERWRCVRRARILMMESFVKVLVDRKILTNGEPLFEDFVVDNDPMPSDLDTLIFYSTQSEASKVPNLKVIPIGDDVCWEFTTSDSLPTRFMIWSDDAHSFINFMDEMLYVLCNISIMTRVD